MVTIQIAALPGPLCDRITDQINRLQDDHGIDCTVEQVSDFEAIVGLGVYAVPGLLIDGELKSVGRVPEIHELLDWLGFDSAQSPSGLDRSDSI